MKKIIDKNQFGPWAIVTGASSGIGEGFATQLAADGLNLVLVARRVNLLEKLGARLAGAYRIQYRVIESDLSMENTIGKIKDATSDLDIGLLVSNAGAGKPAKFLSLDEDTQVGFVQLNGLSHFKLIHHFGKKFVARGRGGILINGAMGAQQGVPYMASMAGSKALIMSLGKSLNYEFREFGIHVTVLETTPTDTPIIPALGWDKGMPMKALTVEQCVEESFRALNANRPCVMPGRRYRIVSALTPESLSRKISGDLMKKNNGIV